MKNHDGTIPGFHWSSRAWYWLAQHKEAEESIQIGFYAPSGGTSGEFHIQWINLGGKQKPQLCVFDDAWHTLKVLPGFIDLLADLDSESDDKSITPEEFVHWLKRNGYQDRTQYERPKQETW